MNCNTKDNSEMQKRQSPLKTGLNICGINFILTSVSYELRVVVLFPQFRRSAQIIQIKGNTEKDWGEGGTPPLPSPPLSIFLEVSPLTESKEGYIHQEATRSLGQPGSWL